MRFYDKRDAEEAMDRLDGYSLDGRDIRVSRAMHPRPVNRYNDERWVTWSSRSGKQELKNIGIDQKLVLESSLNRTVFSAGATVDVETVVAVAAVDAAGTEDVDAAGADLPVAGVPGADLAAGAGN